MTRANHNPTSTRRRFLTIAAAGAAAVVLPAVPALAAGADPDARLRDLVVLWRRQEDEINTPVPGLSDDECDARIDRLSDGHGELADEIADTPAATLAGTVLKLEVSLTIMAQEPHYAHSRMILAALEDLRRLAKGRPA